MPKVHPSEDLAAAYQDHFEGTSGILLFEQGWIPAAVEAVLVLVHGFGEHSGRYGHVAAHLAARGVAVHTYDQRGHGRSEGRRAYVDAFDEFVDDLDVFLQRVGRRMDDKPLFLMGHSAGGAAAALLCMRQSHPVSGLILSSPFLEPADKTAPRWLRGLSGVVARLLPSLPTVKLDRDEMSRDHEEVAKAKSDPLNYHKRIPARAAYELVRAGRSVQQRAHELMLPILIFHGTGDRVAHPDGSYALYRKASSRDKTLSLYDGFYHETLNELERRHVLIDLTRWLEEHL